MRYKGMCLLWHIPFLFANWPSSKWKLSEKGEKVKG